MNPPMRTGALVLAGAALLAACGGSSGVAARSLPSVAASPADTPTPPATAPPTAATAPTTTTTAGTTPGGTPGGTAGNTAGSAAPSALPGSGRVSPCTDAHLTLASDRPSYAAGQQVHLTARLANPGAVTCTVATRAERGFTVATGSTTVWASGCSSTPSGHTATEPCAQFIALMPLQAGQTLTRSQAWSQQADGTVRQVAPGSYVVTESWAGLTASVTISIR